MYLLFYCLTDAIAETARFADDPNKRCDSRFMGEIRISNVDEFLFRFNHDNNYDDGDIKLSVGSHIRIIDGSYYTYWRVAGFDCDHNRKANDNTVYDNGYGIMIVPHGTIFESQFNSTNSNSGGYINSEAHTNKIPTIVNNVRVALGSHIVNRNILLSSSIDGYGRSNGYTWTTTYGSLMSIGQMIGVFHDRSNGLDDGSENYKLPIFNYNNYSVFSPFWCMNIYGLNSDFYYSYTIDEYGSISKSKVTSSIGYRPILYIR